MSFSPLNVVNLTIRSAHFGFLFTYIKISTKGEYNEIHEFINARYHTIHTNLQMVIYTIVYTQSDPVTVNQFAKPSAKFTERTPRPEFKTMQKIKITIIT